MDTNGIELSGRRRHRRHSEEFKASVVQACRHPGVSVAAIALAHQLNANMLRKWVRESERDASAAVTPATHKPLPVPNFMPLNLPAQAEVAATTDIQIDVQRAGARVKITWPAATARECAAWLSDWLR
jgi:transposase